MDKGIVLMVAGGCGVGLGLFRWIANMLDPSKAAAKPEQILSTQGTIVYYYVGRNEYKSGPSDDWLKKYFRPAGGGVVDRVLDWLWAAPAGPSCHPARTVAWGRRSAAASPRFHYIGSAWGTSALASIVHGRPRAMWMTRTVISAN